MSAYRTTLSKRTGQLDLRDFNRLSHLWVNSPSDEVQVSGESIAIWNDFIPYTPTQIYEDLFSKGYEDNTALSIHLSSNGNAYFKQEEYRGRFCADMTMKLGSTVRLEDNNIRVAIGKGQKVGTNAMRIQIETAVAMEAKEFGILAAGANGGYTWFRAGFQMDTDHYDFKNKKYDTGTRYEARLHAIRDFVSIDGYYEARDYVRLENPDDPTRIANIDAALNVEEMLEEKNQRRLRQRLDDFYCQLDNRDFDQLSNYDLEDISEVFHSAAAADKETIPLGRYLQVGTTLPARIDFRDRSQMAQVGTYFGGWKTIEPV